MDIDRVAAEALVACRPAAVVNAAPSISGRYPNLGPADPRRPPGIPLDRRRRARRARRPSARATPVRVARGRASTSATGSSPRARAQTRRDGRRGDGEARAGLAVQLEAFAANTMEFLRRERDLLLDGVGVPDIAHRDRRPARASSSSAGYHYKEDLATLRPYIREYRPVLIGVDGGADAHARGGLPAAT